MNKALCMVLVPTLLLAASDQADQADAPGVAIAATPVVAVTATPPPSPADQACKEAMEALHREREAFVASFDWTRAGDSSELPRGFARTMDRFHRRELELKRDWYAASGQMELLAALERALEAKVDVKGPQPDLNLPRPAAQPQEVTP